MTVWRRHVKDTHRKRDRQRESEYDRADVNRERIEGERKLAEKKRQEEEEERLRQERAKATTNASASALQRDEADGALAIKLGATIPKKRTVSEMDEDEAVEEGPELKKKRVLVKLDYAEVGLLTEEDKRRNPEINESVAKSLIERIPAEKDDLYAYPIPWDTVKRVWSFSRSSRSCDHSDPICRPTFWRRRYNLGYTAKWARTWQVMKS